MEGKKGLTLTGLILFGVLNAYSQVIDRWMTTELEGKPVGYYYMNETSEAESVTSRLNTKLVLNRLKSKIVMTTEAVYTENKDGLQRIEYQMKMSDQVTMVTAEVLKSGLKVTSVVNGTEFNQKLENDKNLYGPYLIRTLTIKKLKSIGDTITFHSYVPEFGKVLAIKRVLLAKEKDYLKVKDLIEGFPESIYHLDHSGYVMMHLARTPFGMIETSVSSKELAESAAEGTILPDEIFDQTMIRNNVRFADARSIDEIVIKVSGKNKSLGLPDLSGSNQEVIEKTDDYVIVKITRPMVDQAQIADPADRTQLVEFLEPNAYITSNDAEIKRIADSVATGDTFQDCQRLRDWVSHNMNFDLGIVLAPAAEVIKNKKGTCSEYTTLLTALYRSSNIPARMALGFVYMGGIWGGHAWPEVYLNNQWVPFDAAIPGSGVADAARLRFASSSLADGPGELNGQAGLQMYGNAIIETLSYKIANKEYKNISELPYVINGKEYLNEGLGMKVSVPPTYSFENKDDVWPKTRFLTVLGSNDQKVSFYQRSILPGQVLDEEMEKAVKKYTGNDVISKKGGYLSWSIDKRVLAQTIVIGNEFILIKYEGENAAELRENIAIDFLQ